MTQLWPPGDEVVAGNVGCVARRRGGELAEEWRDMKEGGGRKR